MEWTNRLWKSFCEKYPNAPAPYPITSGQQVYLFILVLALRAKYALGTINSQILRHLATLHKEQARQLGYAPEYSEDVKAWIKYGVAQASKMPELRAKTARRPIMQFDVQHIISSMPAALATKAEEAAAMIIASHTGARAVTMANIQFGHICGVVKSSSLGSTAKPDETVGGYLKRMHGSECRCNTCRNLDKTNLKSLNPAMLLCTHLY